MQITIANSFIVMFSKYWFCGVINHNNTYHTCILNIVTLNVDTFWTSAYYMCEFVYLVRINIRLRIYRGVNIPEVLKLSRISCEKTTLKSQHV